ncbi:PEP-CTERM sorting domain-containing protein [Pedomonas mirosovicensis]|uniref:PEP-CTERM sorting domain-containing protein n=1 Tax=Pedomonas mirosovicensis TaxID=2908641 RepID=UPI00216A08E9|nr:PEP-CTERM sorting domain-containing protein [Pedomonas mirosovicensis]MCH8684243.1 PEP-CTERM sorting domain-containing protein [Pedomonas mirosovicensis]
MRKGIASIAVSAFAFLTAPQAFAIPVGGLPTGVSGDITDGPFDLTFTLNGGEVVDDADATNVTPNPAPGGNWPITFSVIKEDRSGDMMPAADFVVISGTVFHNFDPHAGEENGAILSFNVTFETPNNPRIVANAIGQDFENIRALDHEGHLDTYTLRAQYTFIGNNILTWSLTINGEHPRVVPEPAALALVGLGLIGAASLRRRKTA